MRIWTYIFLAFPGMFLKSFNKLADRVLSGYKATRPGEAEWLYTPTKPSRSVIKHYIKYIHFDRRKVSNE